MLKQMADGMNISVPEFTKIMEEEYGLVPPDDDEGDPPMATKRR